MELPCTVHLLCLTVGVVSLMRGLLCKYCLNHPSETHMYIFLIYRKVQTLSAINRAKSLLWETFTSHSSAWAGAIYPNVCVPQDIFLYFGSLWFTLCSWESQNSSSPPQEQAGCWGQREPWKWAESETENIDIGQTPAQRPQNDNVLMVLYFSLNYEVK